MHGIRILDLSRVLAGPWAVQQLADQGAEVIKVEPPYGDDTRNFGPFRDGNSTYFLSCNRNKRSICLDLKSPEGHRVLRRLFEWADVVVENYRPQALTRLGLHISSILEAHPALIWTSIRAFGEDDVQSAQRPGYDLVLQCLGGAASITGDEGTPPYKHGNSTADLTTGLTTVQAILLGLLHKEKTGEGQRIVINMLQAQAACLTYHASRWALTGEKAEKRGNSHAGLVPYDLYPCSDGWICIAVGNDRMWQRLLNALDLPDLEIWRTNPQRLKHRTDIDDAIRKAVATWKQNTLCDHLASHDIPSGPVLAPEQTVEHPCVETLQVEHPVIGPMQLLGPPIRTKTTRDAHTAPPALDQHRSEILKELGLSENDSEPLKG